jgi:hypothetical protein
MKTVFILGAGASVEAGAPLMTNFLQKAKELHAKSAYGSDSDQIQDVLDAAYKDLRIVQAKSTVNYKNIEELFSAIDIGQMIQCFGSRPQTKINELRKSIVVFIYRTIEELVRLNLTEGRFNLPNGYDQLVKLVHEKVKKATDVGTTKEISFITFNYDTCLEFTLVRNGLGVDYGLNEPFLHEHEQKFDFNVRRKVPVLKLHGSINWAMCPQCKIIVPTEVDPYRQTNFIDLQIRNQIYGLPLSYAKNFRSIKHKCGATLEQLPFIVPPTWNKSSSTTPSLQDVWMRAAKALASAENIIVIGYSLPTSDMFFKYLFALGINSDVHLDKFIVINGSDAEKSRESFKALLGPMTEDSFQLHTVLFSQSINLINNFLNQ